MERQKGLLGNRHIHKQDVKCCRAGCKKNTPAQDQFKSNSFGAGQSPRFGNGLSL